MTTDTTTICPRCGRKTILGYYWTGGGETGYEPVYCGHCPGHPQHVPYRKPRLMSREEAAAIRRKSRGGEEA